MQKQSNKETELNAHLALRVDHEGPPARVGHDDSVICRETRRLLHASARVYVPVIGSSWLGPYCSRARNLGGQTLGSRYLTSMRLLGVGTCGQRVAGKSKYVPHPYLYRIAQHLRRERRRGRKRGEKGMGENGGGGRERVVNSTPLNPEP
eukprot:2230151-Rhodomonas_salina.1